MTNASTIAFLCLLFGSSLSLSFLLSPQNVKSYYLAQRTTEIVMCMSSRNDASKTEAIEHFLYICSICNERQPGSVRIISRTSKHPPSYVAVTQSIFYSLETTAVYIKLSNNSDGVGEVELEPLSGGKVALTTSEETYSLLGVAPEMVPPFGHLPNANATVIVDKSIVDQCQSEDSMIVGNAGHPYWQCLVTCDALLSLPNIYVGDFQTANVDSNDQLLATAAAASTSTFASKSVDTHDDANTFFPGETPPMNIAKLIVEQRTLSNPLSPTTVKLTGTLGSLEKKTKKLVTTNLLPLGIESETTEQALPWFSKSDGEAFGIKLSFGRALFQTLGKSQWDAILESLEAGQVVSLTAQTRVIDRGSLRKWVDDRRLELEVRDFRILSNDPTDQNDDSTSESVDTASSPKPFKHKPKSEWTTPQFPPVTMEDIFGRAASIELVDSVECLQSFVSEIANLSSLPIDENSRTPSRLTGIDCEWKPNQLSARGEKQPVLLLQICLDAPQKVYLFDLQTLLRPLLQPTEEMNELEASVSAALGKLFRSKSFVKVGYQVSSDLIRVAASYPHVSCFQEVQSVLEVDCFVKRTLQIKKQKRSRAITMSLAKLSAHYLNKSISKKCQVSDWSARPFTKEQLEYAAIDAAIGPVLVKKAMESINATVNAKTSRVERWEGDDGINKVICNWRFTHFCQSEENEAQLGKLRAKQVFGLAWTVSQNWIGRNTIPSIPSLQ